MSVKGIIMFLWMNNTRLERKILIILDFENGVLPTYLPQCNETEKRPIVLNKRKNRKISISDIDALSWQNRLK